MPSFCCLRTSHPFSAQGRASACFAMNKVERVPLLWSASGFAAHVVWSLGAFEIPLFHLLPSEPAGCTGQWSAQLASLLLV